MRWILLLVLGGCWTGSAPPASSSAAAACPADTLGALTAFGDANYSCEDEATCAQRCSANDRDACLVGAQADDDSPKAPGMYLRSCELGLAIGCTNYGAFIFFKGTRADAACAERMFAASCAAREPFGCGMRGRVLAFTATTDEHRAAARAHFDHHCEDIGNVVCRMYALHLEKGHLGTSSPALVKALMLRACETGDTEACDHDVASETFN